MQSGQNFPLGTFGAHGALRAFGAHGRLGTAPLATNCWSEAPRWGGGSWRPRTRGVAPPPGRGPVAPHSKQLGVDISVDGAPPTGAVPMGRSESMGFN